jgi:hypothetical protein
MGLRSDSVAGVRFLAAVREGRGIKPAVRSVGVHPWTGYRWLREAFLAHRCNGLSAAAAQSELGFFTAKALLWEAPKKTPTVSHADADTCSHGDIPMLGDKQPRGFLVQATPGVSSPGLVA